MPDAPGNQISNMDDQVEEISFNIGQQFLRRIHNIQVIFKRDSEDMKEDKVNLRKGKKRWKKHKKSSLS